MTPDEFTSAYNSNKLYAYAQDEERCHIGSAPTLGDAMHTYGRPCVLAVIDELLTSLVNFTSARVRLTPDQRKRLAWVVLSQYTQMRTTELILFVVKAQAGHFGKFYATIDPIDITTALCQWWKICQLERNRLLYEKTQRERQQERDNASRNNAAHRDEIVAALLNGQFDFKLKN